MGVSGSGSGEMKGRRTKLAGGREAEWSRLRVPAWLMASALAGGILWMAGAGPASGGERTVSLVEQLRQSGASVTSLGKSGAMDGWWVEPAAGEAYSLYVDETGHAVLGTMYGPDGSGVTGRQLEAMRPDRSGSGPAVRSALPSASRPASAAEGAGAGATKAPQAVSSPAALLEAGMAAEGFELGESGPQVVTFADPGCRPSRAAVAMLAKRAVDGELRLKVVPVGMLGESSKRRAGAVVASENRALAWFSPDRDGGPAESGAGARAAVDLNGRLFLRGGSEFVPWSIRMADDGAVSTAVGLDFGEWFGG